MNKFITPIILSISTILIAVFIKIGSADDKGFSVLSTPKSVLFSGGIFGILIIFISIIIWGLALKRNKSDFITWGSLLVLSWAYINTLMTWASEPTGKFDFRFTSAWNCSWIVGILLTINIITHLIITNKKKIVLLTPDSDGGETHDSDTT